MKDFQDQCPARDDKYKCNLYAGHEQYPHGLPGRSFMEVAMRDITSFAVKLLLVELRTRAQKKLEER
jgi:hypothetical protein